MVWPAGAVLDADEVLLPDGRRFAIGDDIESGGGYYRANALPSEMDVGVLERCLLAAVEDERDDVVILSAST